MGSKNLEGCCSQRPQSPPVANPEKVKEIRQQLSKPHPISQFGTGGPEMLRQEATGDLPIRNFRDGGFSGGKPISMAA